MWFTEVARVQSQGENAPLADENPFEKKKNKTAVEGDLGVEV